MLKKWFKFEVKNQASSVYLLDLRWNLLENDLSLQSPSVHYNALFNIFGNWLDEWMNGSLIPEGESFEEFVRRTLVGVNKALAQRAPILIVAHGGTYWSIQNAVQLPDLPDPSNCVLASFSPPKSVGGKWSCSHFK